MRKIFLLLAIMSMTINSIVKAEVVELKHIDNATCQATAYTACKAENGFISVKMNKYTRDYYADKNIDMSRPIVEYSNQESNAVYIHSSL